MLFIFLVVNSFILTDLLLCCLGEDLIIELRQHTDYITGIHSVLLHWFLRDTVSNDLTWLDQPKNLFN